MMKKIVEIIIFTFICFIPFLSRAQINFEIEPASCQGKRDGSIQVSVDLDGRYRYEIKRVDDDENGLLHTDLYDSGHFTNLSAGIYLVEVESYYTWCKYSEYVVVESATNLSVSIGAKGDLRYCDDRGPRQVTLTMSASGGVSPYDLSWPGGSITTSSSGTYIATVEDAAGCTENQIIEIFFVSVNCSKDPNDMIGPEGYGAPKWVSVKEELPYTIRFENDPDFATAPAQKVIIEHVLDDNLNLYSLRLADFGFANMVFEVPSDRTFYSERLDLRDSLGIFVDVTAGIDVTKNKAFWIFESIDPATGLAPNAVDLGMLPVNDTLTHEGEGYVSFVVSPDLASETGDTVHAVASIIFDENEVISTPPIFNVIDAVAPNSAVQSIPVSVDPTNFTISWEGQDDEDGSGLKEYALYYSENGNPFTFFQSALTDTFLTFPGNQGTAYDFYTLATDNVYNTEVPPTIPDAAFLIPAEKSLSITSLNKNVFCAGDSVIIQWNSSGLNTVDILFSEDGLNFMPIHTNLPADSSVYKWQIPLAFAGCSDCKISLVDTTENTIFKDTSTFIVHASPNIELSADTSICIGDYTILQVAGGENYTWSPTTNLSNNSVANPIVIVAESQKFTVEVIDTNSCLGTDSIQITAISPSMTDIIELTCDTLAIGLSRDTLINQYGCDSVLSITTNLATLSPALACVPSFDANLEEDGMVTITAADIDANSSENCEIDMIYLSQTSFTCEQIGQNSITLYAQYKAGNIDSCQTIVTITDNNNACDCLGEDLLIHDNGISSKTYAASNTIISEGIVDKDSIVIFQAATSITLRPGFHAQSGSDFLAEITDCSITNITELLKDTTFAKRILPIQNSTGIKVKVVPNPFFDKTKIQFTLAESEQLNISVYNLTGELIEVLSKETNYDKGTHEILFDSKNNHSSMYLLVIQGKNIQLTKKMVLIK